MGDNSETKAKKVVDKALMKKSDEKDWKKAEQLTQIVSSPLTMDL